MSFNKNDSFCSLPFTSFSTFNRGTVKICCESKTLGKVGQGHQNFEGIWNGALWKEVRKSFMAGKKHPVCQHCWDQEARGQFSFRQSHRHDDYDQDLVNASGESLVGPEEVHIRLGNECNLKCVMCTPHNSTKWFAEASIFKKFVDPYFGDEVKTELINDEWVRKSFENAKRIQFAGGEPFIIPQHAKIIDHLISGGFSKDIELIYYTNGTFLKDSMVEKLKKFRKVLINVSVDGYRETYNYVRFPGRWNQAVENLLKIDQLTGDQFQMRIFTVYFILTAFDIDEFFEFRNRVQWKNCPEVVLQDLTEPYFFDVRCMSQENKRLAAQKLKHVSENLTRTEYEKICVERLIKSLPESGTLSEDESFQTVRSYLSELDSSRKTNHVDCFSKVFPGLFA